MKKDETITKEFFKLIGSVILVALCFACLLLISNCTGQIKRSSLINDPCLPLPCKLALEYGRQEYKGKKEMSGVLWNWCKDTYNKTDYKSCRKDIKLKK